MGVCAVAAAHVRAQRTTHVFKSARVARPRGTQDEHDSTTTTCYVAPLLLLMRVKKMSPFTAVTRKRIKQQSVLYETRPALARRSVT